MRSANSWSRKAALWPGAVGELVDTVARRGATPLVVADGRRVLGVVELRDIVKGGIRERFAELRQMGIKTVMVTGDNRLTAAAIAAEAGVDEFLAEATPEAKLELIRRHQKEGHLVAMCGDGTNDAPALAQADVAVAMNTGTQAAKEAGNMVDLDSNPTKLIEVVDVGKQMLVTRGALTTFSIANDVAKYFAIIPAAFATTYPALDRLNVMRLTSPESAILSAVIFNALIIIVLVPLALRGVKTRASSAAVLLRRNMLIYGLGGIVVPFVGIKLIDMLLAASGTGLRRMNMLRELKPTLVIFALLTLVTGVAYPGVVWIFAQLVVPERATGSVIERDGKAVGSRLLGQTFTSPRYFWGRPSATGPFPDNGAVSSGSNQGATNPASAHRGARSRSPRCAPPIPATPRPCRSIWSRLPAAVSIRRSRRPRPSSRSAGWRAHAGIELSRVRQLVAAATEGRTFGFLGEPRVNVLELNLALDAQDKQAN